MFTKRGLDLVQPTCPTSRLHNKLSLFLRLHLHKTIHPVILIGDDRQIVGVTISHLMVGHWEEMLTHDKER